MGSKGKGSEGVLENKASIKAFHIVQIVRQCHTNVPFESSYFADNKSIRQIWTDGTKMRILVRYIAILQKSHHLNLH